MNEQPRFEDEENVIDIHAPRPKAAGAPPKGGDWLSGMTIDTDFLVRDKTGHLPKWVVLEYTHGGTLTGPEGAKNTLLLPTRTMNDIKTWQWVDAAVFCDCFEFRGITKQSPQE